jgi:hypothetical protein
VRRTQIVALARLCGLRGVMRFRFEMDEAVAAAIRERRDEVIALTSRLGHLRYDS